MVARLTFENVGFVQTSTQSIRVAMSPKPFSIVIEGAEEGSVLRIASIGDKITKLDEAEDGLSASVTATAVGTGEIQLQDADRKVVFWLGIEVYNAAEAVAVTVREIADEPRS